MKSSGLAAMAACLGLALTACNGESEPLNQPPVDTDPDPDPEPEEVSDIPITLQQALADFGACMSVEVWVKTGIYQLYKAEVQGGIECQSCHIDETGGAAISDDVLWMFEKHTELPSIMRLVTGTVDERGQFRDLVAANRYSEKGTGQCLDPDTCHPEYTLPAHMQSAIAEFVDESLDRWHNGNCNAPYTPNAEN